MINCFQDFSTSASQSMKRNEIKPLIVGIQPIVETVSACNSSIILPRATNVIQKLLIQKDLSITASLIN
jgi:hypothetical protein